MIYINIYINLILYLRVTIGKQSFLASSDVLQLLIGMLYLVINIF